MPAFPLISCLLLCVPESAQGITPRSPVALEALVLRRGEEPAVQLAEVKRAAAAPAPGGPTRGVLLACGLRFPLPL